MRKKIKNKKPAKMGRPKVFIDLALVEDLAKIHCTMTEIAAVLKVPLSTLSTRPDFSEIYKRSMDSGKASLRRLQFRMAEKSAAMAIWLGKQYLDQVDTREVTIPDAGQYFAKIADAISRTDTNTESVLS